MVRHIQRFSKKATKAERLDNRRKHLEHHQAGSGLYRFRNKSKQATLVLPKPAKDGRKVIGPNGEWEGDSYFLSMVPREAILVLALQPQVQESQIQESEMPEEKLILDQPATVTTSGAVEHIVSNPQVSLNEQPSESKNPDRLLNEDPMDGVTIIRD